LRARSHRRQRNQLVDRFLDGRGACHRRTELLRAAARRAVVQQRLDGRP
jgi:hypothetical protein